MGGSCEPRQLVRDWRKVESLSSARVAKNQESYVNFRTVEARPLGLHRHVRAIRIRGSVQIISAASSAAVTRHAVLSLISNIKLSDVEGWRYIEGNIDGRMIEDAEFFRGGLFLAREPQNVGGAAANANTTTLVPIDLIIDLAGRVPGVAQTERLIPLAALQDREAEALKFTPRAALPFLGTANLGVTIGNYFQGDGVTQGLDVWIDVVDLPAANVPPRWGLRCYEKLDKSGSLDFPEATHLFAICRPMAEDAASDAGEALLVTVDGVTVKVGGQDVLSNASALDWATRDALILKSEPESIVSRGALMANFDLGKGLAASVSSRPWAIMLPPRNRESAPAGRVNFQFATNTANKIRVLHEFVMCGDASREARIRRAVGIKSAMRSQRGASLPEGLVIDKTGPVLVQDGGDE